MSYLTLFLWIGLPLLVSKGRAYFKKTPSRPTHPKSVYDKYATAFLLFVAVLQLCACVVRPPNVLVDLGIGLETPSFVLRNTFRNHMAARYPGWASGAVRPEDEARVATAEKIHESLKTTSARKEYLRHGHAAHIECGWCTEPRDYALYAAPPILVSYGLMLVLLGIGTVTWRKQLWRTYGAVFIGLIAICEFYMFAMHDAVLSEADGTAWSLYNSVRMWRHAGFAVLALLAALVDRKDEWTDEDVVKDILGKNQVIYNRSQASRLARAATLTDSNMRRKFMEHYKEHEAVNDAIDRDLEYKEIRDKSLQKYDLDKLMQEASALSGNIVQAAIDEGLIDPSTAAEISAATAIPEPEDPSQQTESHAPHPEEAQPVLEPADAASASTDSHLRVGKSNGKGGTRVRRK
ncbi:hypothetical protein HDU87_003676 [Geranomyces variabilis]|uniref:Uncharacterized protein n=1 Tax=Geranomyces variabilis TaxID=109894 RepID=A0AAD5XSH3_9FUNG|nr:hypothetical protein HDU87_003676 [Geranomyces variabilis]